MIPDTPEQLHHKEASELQSNVSDANSGVQQTHRKTLLRVLRLQEGGVTLILLIIQVG